MNVVPREGFRFRGFTVLCLRAVSEFCAVEGNATPIVILAKDPPQTPSSSRRRGPSAWRIDQSGDGRAGDEAHRETAEISWILFQPSSEPRTQVRGLSTCQVASASRASRHGYRTGLGATRNRWVPAGAIQSFATKSEPRAEASGQLAIAAKLRARRPADRDYSRNG